MITLVAAMGRNRVIGRDGSMPWRLPAEMRHFRRVTMGQVVVMGRKTYESIGGPLKGRINVVVTRDPGFHAPGCEVVHSIEALLRDPRPLYIIGGAQLYRQMLPHAGRMILSRIHHDFPGDTYFPDFPADEWECTEAVEYPADEESVYGFTVEWYRRVRPPK